MLQGFPGSPLQLQGTSLSSTGWADGPNILASEMKGTVIGQDRTHTAFDVCRKMCWEQIPQLLENKDACKGKRPKAAHPTKQSEAGLNACQWTDEQNERIMGRKS